MHTLQSLLSLAGVATVSTSAFVLASASGCSSSDEVLLSESVGPP